MTLSSATSVPTPLVNRKKFPSSLLKEIDVLCVGHAAFDLSMFLDGFPEENSKREIHEMTEACGGPAANAAYLLSKWGCRCAFAGLVGNDLYGERIRADFVSAGTDVTLLELRSEHVTPLSTILINKQNGSRTIVNHKRAGSLGECDFRKYSPSILYFDGHELEASLAALDAHPDAISILDAGSWREGTATLAGKVTYLAASERFALQATGLGKLENADEHHQCVKMLREKYATTVIVTLGERGLIFDAGSGYEHLPAFPAVAVDTTAAGDIFHGAFAHAVLQRLTLRDALRLASMAAALSVQFRGGRPSIPALLQVQDALANAPR